MKKSRLSLLIQRQLVPAFVGTSMVLAAGSVLAQTNNDKAARFYEDALGRYEKKDMPGAIIQLKNALQIDPKMLPVQMLLGKALMQNGEVAAAEVAFNEALKLGVNRAEVAVPLANSYIAQGKQSLIFEQATFKPEGLPPSVQLPLHLLRAAARADMGDTRAALLSVDEARAIDSRSADVWLEEVPIRIRAGQLKEATIAADRALALAPGSAGVWYQKGSILHVQRNLRGALEAYDKVLQIQPAHTEARVARVGIYLDMARYEDAAKDVAELRRLSPKEPRGAYMKALLAERDGDATGAIAALKEVTALLDPVPIEYVRYRPQVLMLNGLAHFGLHENEKAKQYLEAFQRSHSTSPTSKLLARLYLADNNAGSAVSVLETYLKAQPGDGQAMTLLASAYMGVGKPAKATALMQDALKTQDNPNFRTALGLSLLRSGQSEGGAAELEAAYKKDPQQQQAAVALVQLYLRNQQPRKAMPIAESLVKTQPSNAGYHDLLGMALGQSGKPAESKAAFEKAIQLNGSLTSAKINLARVEAATGAVDAASARLNELLKVENKNSEAMFELAMIAERKGQQANAQLWLERARDLAGPRELQWGIALVDFHLRNGRAGAALDAAKVASGRAPDDLPTLLAYSRAQLATGDTVGAKSTLTGATRFAEYRPALQVEIAGLQIAARNVAGAAYSLDKALTTQPDYLPAQIMMTEVELAQGELVKAEKRAKDLTTLYPRRAFGPMLVGDVALAKGQTAVAIDAYRRSHQLEPSSVTVLRLFRASMAQPAGVETAAPVAEQWLKNNPKDLAVRKALANGYAGAGNFKAAEAAYEAALKMNPDDVDVLNNLANVQLRLKNPAAIKTAELALAKAPGSALIIDTLGWALFQNGQTDRALQLLRDARLRQPENPEIRYHLAAVLAQTNRKSEAREELDAAIKDGGAFESVAEAQKLLKDLR